jgi:hypothetical protein
MAAFTVSEPFDTLDALLHGGIDVFPYDDAD